MNHFQQCNNVVLSNNQTPLSRLRNVGNALFTMFNIFYHTASVFINKSTF